MKQTRILAIGGILAAMAIVLKVFSFTTLDYRFTFYDIPLMVAGIAFGPVVGGITGFVTDWIYATTHGWPIGLFTISSILWGLLPGLLMIMIKEVNVKVIILIVLITSISAFAMNTLALYQLSGSGVFALMPARAITMVIKWPIEVILLSHIYQRVMIPFKIKRV
ncbi:folate family ECF transporter S component [Mycoplasmatota bacterium]|nr:folate family ECF transporter S component [Mycoplasmatota bacterium]